MTYEETVKELEKTVSKLQDEKIGIEESLALYAKGIALAQSGLAELKNFKGKIELLNKDLTELTAETESDDE